MNDFGVSKIVPKKLSTRISKEIKLINLVNNSTFVNGICQACLQSGGGMFFVKMTKSGKMPEFDHRFDMKKQVFFDVF